MTERAQVNFIRVAVKICAVVTIDCLKNSLERESVQETHHTINSKKLARFCLKRVLKMMQKTEGKTHTCSPVNP